ncbi:MAG: DegV family protein [Thermoleophilia bacterium]|nr:DegV family protein [Thermoleophilia bacterium]
MQTTQATIAIVTDASADVPIVERDHGGAVPWIVLPETWHAGLDVDICDDGEQSQELTQLILSGLKPEVSEPRYEAFVDAYEQLAECDRVFSIHPPPAVSMSAELAREAAGAFPNVRVVEATVAGLGLGLLAACARDLAAGGASPDELEEWLRAHRAAVRMLVVPDRFDPTATQRGLAARLLSGRPMLQSSALGGGSPGVFDRSKRLNSRRATVAAIEKYFAEHTSPGVPIRMALGHADAAGAVDPFLDLLERIRPDAEVALVGRVGPRMLEQLGARCVAAAWFEDVEPPVE